MAAFPLSAKLAFPPPQRARFDGLLAYGGDLSVERLKLAYSKGIFPWFDDEPILWWSPDPRMVLVPDQLRVAKSMRSMLRNPAYRVTADTAFRDVVKACRQVPREGQHGTWITPEMVDAYVALHESGWAHSVEVWHENTLIAGLYGVVVGKVFCGESMFTHVPNASKLAFITLVRHLNSLGFTLIDCQVYTDHLASLGAVEIPRAEFLSYLPAEDVSAASIKSFWQPLP